MDIAYDHLQESFTEEATTQPNRASSSTDSNQPVQQPATLNAEIQDAYRAISNSPWGARIGGFFGSVVKQVGAPRPFICPPPRAPRHRLTTAATTNRANPSTGKPSRSSRPSAKTPRAASLTSAPRSSAAREACPYPSSPLS